MTRAGGQRHGRQNRILFGSGGERRGIRHDDVWNRVKAAPRVQHPEAWGRVHPARAGKMNGAADRVDQPQVRFGPQLRVLQKTQ